MEIQESESNELLRLELQFALKFLPCMGGVLRWYEAGTMREIHNRAFATDRNFIMRSDWSIKERAYSRSDGVEKVNYTFLLEVEVGKIALSGAKSSEVKSNVFTISMEITPGNEEFPQMVVVNDEFCVPCDDYFDEASIESMLEWIFNMELFDLRPYNKYTQTPEE